MTAVNAGVSRVDFLDIYSVSMHKTIRCKVIRPGNYSVSGQPYPVLYLLHGWSGNYTGWLSDAPQLLDAVNACNLIVVCPDGGYDSWYLDSPVNPAVQYETHITREVIPFIDYYYFTRRDRSGRAIAGLSMGGHGALYLAFRHPDLFGAAGSMAGGLDFGPFRRNDWDLQRVLGAPHQFPENWNKYSVVNLIHHLDGVSMPLILDCGLSDFFLDVNRKMHRRLSEAGIPHQYTERSGDHDRAYWGTVIDELVGFFAEFFEENGA